MKELLNAAGQTIQVGDRVRVDACYANSSVVTLVAADPPGFCRNATVRADSGYEWRTRYARLSPFTTKLPLHLPNYDA